MQRKVLFKEQNAKLFGSSSASKGYLIKKFTNCESATAV
jgi:hypothetical protein